MTTMILITMMTTMMMTTITKMTRITIIIIIIIFPRCKLTCEHDQKRLIKKKKKVQRFKACLKS